MSKASLLDQSVKNSSYASLGTVLTFVVTILFAGFRIRLLGAERTGYMMLLESVIEMSALIGGFGIGTAALRKIAISHGKNEYPAMRRTMRLALFVNVAVGIVVFVISAVAFNVIFRWSRTNSAYYTDAHITTLLLGFLFLIRQLSATYEMSFSAFQRYDILSGMQFVFGLLNGAGGLLILKLSPHMSSLALFSVLLFSSRLLVDVNLVKRLIPGRLLLPKWDLAELRTMLHFSGWTYLTSLSMILMNGLDKIVLTAYLGSSSLPYYVIGQRIVSQVHTFLAGQSQFLFPMLAGQGQQTREIVKNVEDRLRWFMAFISAVIYSILASFAWLLLTKLVGPQFAQIAFLPFLLACLQGFFHAQGIVPYHISWAQGKGAPNAFYVLFIGVMVTTTTILLTPTMGILGASLAQLWHGAASLLLILWVLHDMGKIDIFKVIRPFLSPLLIMALWFGAIHWVAAGDLKILGLGDTLRVIFIALSSIAGGIYVEYKLFDKYRCIDTFKRASGLLLGKLLGKLRYKLAARLQ